MKKRTPVFTVFCAVLFFAFSAFMIWLIPSYASVRMKIDETRQELELNRGRELKQQSEYDSAVEELPLILAELEEKNPIADEAEQAVAELKARRKELRAKKKELEESTVRETETQDTSGAGEEVPSDE